MVHSNFSQPIEKVHLGVGKSSALASPNSSIELIANKCPNVILSKAKNLLFWSNTGEVLHSVYPEQSERFRLTAGLLYTSLRNNKREILAMNSFSKELEK